MTSVPYMAYRAVVAGGQNDVGQSSLLFCSAVTEMMMDIDQRLEIFVFMTSAFFKNIFSSLALITLL